MVVNWCVRSEDQYTQHMRGLSSVFSWGSRPHIVGTSMITNTNSLIDSDRSATSHTKDCWKERTTTYLFIYSLCNTIHCTILLFKPQIIIFVKFSLSEKIQRQPIISIHTRISQWHTHKGGRTWQGVSKCPCNHTHEMEPPFQKHISNAWSILEYNLITRTKCWLLIEISPVALITLKCDIWVID